MSMHLTAHENIIQRRQHWAIVRLVLLVVGLIASVFVVHLPAKLSPEYLLAIPVGVLAIMGLLEAALTTADSQQQRKIIALLKDLHTKGLENDRYYLLFCPSDRSVNLRPEYSYPSLMEGDYELGSIPTHVQDVAVRVMDKGLSISMAKFDMENWAKAGNVILVFLGNKIPESFSFLPTASVAKTSNSQAVNAALVKT